MTDLPYTLKVDTWETPATKYPLGKVGTAEVARKRQHRGFYRMEAVLGYLFYRATKPIMITDLKIHGRIWMVDDPLQWLGMKELAKHSEGKVLVGGLGLGLVVHALLENSAVTQIDVVEINSDVISLIKPCLPGSEKMRVFPNDVLKFDPLLATHDTDFQDYKTVILDLWVGAGTKETAREMLSTFAHMKWRYPKANIMIWGHGAHWLNPSVDLEVRKKIPEYYYEE